MNIKEKQFEIRTYGFSELAQCYSPKINKESAANKLRNWIAASKELQIQLKDVGYRKGNKVLTPRHVRLIVEYLDAP